MFTALRTKPLMVAVMILLPLAFLAGCSDDDPVTGPTSSEFDIVSDAARTWLAVGKAPAMSSSALYTTLNDGIASNDPFILDIRSATDYAAGHIAGAVNVPYRDVAQAANVNVYPSDKEIVVVCYTGHTASQVTSWLGAMGYDATALKFGMTSWTIDPADNPSVATIKPYDVDQDCEDYPVSTASVTTGTFATPDFDNTTASDDASVIRAAADVFLSSGQSGVSKASALYTNLNDGNSSNDPVVLDIRGAADYAAGHAEGAINIGFRSVADATNLTKLDKSKAIVVVCYTGHTASQTAMLLRMMGYDATAMKFGMTSWTVDPADNPSITTIKHYDSDNDCGNYPCVKS